MRDLHALEVTREHHRVVTHDGAATQRMEGDLSFRTLPDEPPAAVARHIVKLHGASFGSGVRQHQGRTGRSVLLVLVVHFDDFDVVLRPEHRRGLTDKSQEQIYAK